MIFHINFSSQIIPLFMILSCHLTGFAQNGKFTIDTLYGFRNAPFFEDTLGEVSGFCDLVCERGFIDGVLRRESFVKNDELWGVTSIFDSTGRLSLLENYTQGCLDGLTIGFWPNGQISFFGYYQCLEVDAFISDTLEFRDDLLLISMTPSYSVKTGNWIYYDALGKFIRREIWNEDKLVRVFEMEQ